MEQCLQQESVQLRVIASHPDLIPAYATKGSSGLDLKANVTAPITIRAKSFERIPTGLFFEIPPGYEVQIRPRSGLAAKSGITVLNAPGTIDSDYRGEIQVLLINHSEHDFVVSYGMRIAQMVVSPVVQAEISLVTTISSSERGSGGFGHTGTQ